MAPRPSSRSRTAKPAKTADKSAPAEARRAPAPTRPYWSGQLRLALVSLPVKIYSATKSGARIPLHQIDAKTGKRIRYEKVVPGVGPVDEATRSSRASRYEKGDYVLLDRQGARQR